jgi:hypothetical protein
LFVTNQLVITGKFETVHPTGQFGFEQAAVHGQRKRCVVVFITNFGIAHVVITGSVGFGETSAAVGTGVVGTDRRTVRFGDHSTGYANRLGRETVGQVQHLTGTRPVMIVVIVSMHSSCCVIVCAEQEGNSGSWVSHVIMPITSIQAKRRRGTTNTNKQGIQEGKNTYNSTLVPLLKLPGSQAVAVVARSERAIASFMVESIAA